MVTTSPMNRSNSGWTNVSYLPAAWGMSVWESIFQELGMAEIDGSRLVWAEAGILSTGKVNASGLSERRVLIDLNPMKFEPLADPC